MIFIFYFSGNIMIDISLQTFWQSKLDQSKIENGNGECAKETTTRP